MADVDKDMAASSIFFSVYLAGGERVLPSFITEQFSSVFLLQKSISLSFKSVTL